MLAAATSVATLADRPAPRRHLSRRGLGQIARRDPRRFGKAIARVAVAPPVIAQGSESLRLFAHTFGASFLFVTVFLA